MGLDVQNTGAEIKLRAERRLGQWLAEREPNKGGRPTSETPDTVSGVSDDPAPLADLGISHKQSERWQRIGHVPEDKFESYLSGCRERNEEITSKGAAVLAAQGRQHEPVVTPHSGAQRARVSRAATSDGPGAGDGTRGFQAGGWPMS
jgi:hypothetical protein